MLVAHQESGTVVPFLIDERSGEPTPAGEAVSVPGAVCVAFLDA